MAGILTKDTKFFVGTATYNAATGSYTLDFTSATEIPNLQEIPSLGGTPEKVEVTCMGDKNRKYITGIKDFGDLAFKFLYDNSAATSNYRLLRGFEESGDVKAIRIELNDPLTGTGTHHGSQFEFAASIAVAVDSGAVNSAYTFTCNTALQSDVTVNNPA